MKQKTVLLFIFLVAAFSGRAQTEKFVVDYSVFAPKLKAQKAPQVIDTRSKEEYAINHINNAVNIDLSSPDYQQRLQPFSKSSPVFIYAINTSRSSRLANELSAAGFNEIYVLRGGIAAWIGSGEPYFSSVKNKISKEEFNQLTNNEKPVLVEFVSRYCGACRRAGQITDSFKIALVISFR